MIFTLEYKSDSFYVNDPFYSATEGILNITKVASEQVIGEFDVVVHDTTSSCMECPETLKETKGKFNAIVLYLSD